MALKVDDPRLHDAVKRYLSGDSVESASKPLGLSPNVLRRHLKETGLTRDPAESRRLAIERSIRTKRLRLQAHWPEIKARYEAGEGLLPIAESLGEARNAIQIALEEMGVPIRTQAEHNALIGERMTARERKVRAARAMKVHTGRTASLETLIKRARTRQERQVGVDPAEQLLQEWLKQLGLDSIPQQAIGPYNADLGAHPVAVEIYGGNWHAVGRHAARFPDRCRYFLDEGWALIIIWVDRSTDPLRREAAEYVHAFAEKARRDPSLIGQYRMIGGSGQLHAVGRLDDDNLADVVASRRRQNRRASYEGS